MRKERDKPKDVRLSVIDVALYLVIAAIGSLVIATVVGCFLLKVGVDGIMYVLSDKYVIMGWLILWGVTCVPIIYIVQLRVERNYVLKRIRGETAAIEGNLENSHFITKKEMLKKGFRTVTSREELRQSADGVPIGCTEKNGELEVTFAPEKIHALVLGTTGSGKTATFVIPSIRILAETQTKPSFLFTDPKGELYEKTAWALRANGYDVKVLDFRHPETSAHWNPLETAFEKYRKAQYVAEYTTYNGKGYELFGKEYSENEIAAAEMTEKQKLEDEAFDDVNTIVSAICPVNEREPIWDNGAKSLIQAVVLAMLEDSQNPTIELPLEKFCLYNVAKICSKTDDDCRYLKEYFSDRPKTSLAVQYSNMVLSAPDKQRGSYMSSVAEKLQLFTDRGVCSMTSGKSDIAISEADERPTAIFLLLPDEKQNRHGLGSLFISEAYKRLVEKAIANGGALKRTMYFIMDEYGNMPKIDGVEGMFTVGRSRGIIQIPVIQSYSQIIAKYGTETANTIFGNCNIEIFVGAKDEDTCKRFSEKLGNYTVLSTSSSDSAATRLGKATEHNFSENMRERPLMYPQELRLLNNKKDMGNVVVVNQGYEPYLGKFTPYFKSKVFENKTEADVRAVPKYFDEAAVLYDFTERKAVLEAERREYLKEVEELEQSAASDKPADSAANDGILSEFAAIAKTYGKEFGSDESANLSVMEEVIALLREDRKMVKLNIAVKLRAQYEAMLEHEKTEQANGEKEELSS